MSDYDDPPEAWTETRPRARQAHRCCECRGTIEPGEHYQRFSGIWDHRPQRFKTCDDCRALREKLAECTDGCWEFERMADCLSDQFDHPAHDPDRHAFYRILEKRNPGSLEQFANWKPPANLKAT